MPPTDLPASIAPRRRWLDELIRKRQTLSLGDAVPMPRTFAASPSIWYYVDGCLDEIGRKKGERDWEVARVGIAPRSDASRELDRCRSRSAVRSR
jgi:hypothetical protein